MSEVTAPSTSKRPPATSAACEEMEAALARMPFRVELSFEPLFRQLRGLTDHGSGARCEQARTLIRGLEGIEALRGAVDAATVVRAHAESLGLLMGFVFPELSGDEVPARVYVPFTSHTVFTTPGYDGIFESEDVEVTFEHNLGEIDYYREHLLFAYIMLFHIHYGVDHTNRVLVKRVRDTKTGLDRFFLLDYRFRFVDVSHPGLEIPPQKEFARLLDMEDLAELTRRVPLDGVVFSGFNYIRYHEITEVHNLSLLKSELVEPNALNTPALFDRIRQRMRSILRVPDLDAGLALRYESMSEHRYCTLRSVIKEFDGCLSTIEHTIYGEVVESRMPRFVPELLECDCDSDVVAHLRAQGVRSLGLVPLIDGDKVIGLLELTSKHPEEINASAGKKLADLIPPLTIAARREIDEVVSQIERTIKAHCTAIHPTVEWRFEDAAYRYIREMADAGSATFEDIAFENVFPLYGAMDIRGSSDSRTQAIQADLVEHLDLARATLRCVHESHAMPIADYYDAALGRYRASVSEGLRSGDELSVIEFLKSRVEPFLDYVKEHMPCVPLDDGSDPVETYYARMDPAMGILYERRKHYEDSVALINDTLAAFLDEQEAKAQAIFPHYFERYKTDGVEHNIYVGQSMTNERAFDEVQLENLRLWQLQVTCEQARLAESLVPRMRVPLRTTPLVLVQSSPLTIQFKTEAKQFQVEGAYNIRYEIIKKRIDKATVRGTGERLTQPGRLSVIYSQDKEGDQYRRYLEYLAEKGFVHPEIENLELDDLPGVYGLHALRTPIVMAPRD